MKKRQCVRQVETRRILPGISCVHVERVEKGKDRMGSGEEKDR